MADLLGIGSIVSGISNAFTGAMQARTAKRNTDMTNKANRELAEYAYSKDLEMWKRQNEYNNPSMQMGRLKEAGLNPNMIYGSGKATGNTSSQLPKYQTPKMDYNYEPVVQGLPSAIGAFQDFALKNAQIDNVEAQSDINKTEADWRDKILHNKTLVGASKADIEKMKKEWWYSKPDEGEVWPQRGFQYLETQAEAKREAVRMQGVRMSKMDEEINLLEKKTLYQQKVNQLYNVIQLGKLGVGIGNMVTGGLGKVAGSLLKQRRAKIGGTFKDPSFKRMNNQDWMKSFENSRYQNR